MDNSNLDFGPWAIQEQYVTAVAGKLRQAVGDYAGVEHSVSDGVATIKLHDVLDRRGDYGGTSTDAAAAVLSQYANDKSVRGVILDISSPGGKVAGTKALADVVASTAKVKPVYASISDIGASAAYWIASQATKVYAEPDALVGSIGVYTVIPDVSRAAENAGVKMHVVKAGQFKGSGVPGTPVSADALAEVQKHIDSSYRMFVGAVQSGRNMNPAHAAMVSDGRMFSAEESVQLGLVDGVATSSQAREFLSSATSKGGRAVSSTLKERADAFKAAMPRVTEKELLQFILNDVPLETAMAAHIVSLYGSIDAAESARKSEPAAEDKKETQPEQVNHNLLSHLVAELRKSASVDNGNGTVQPLPNKSNAPVKGDVDAAWEAEIARIRAAKKCDRYAAICEIRLSNPSLHAARYTI